MNKKEIISAIILKSIAVILMVAGVLNDVFGSGVFMAGPKSLLYFTIQSNILAAIICAVDLVFDARRLSGKEVLLPRAFNYFKLVATTSVTLTLLVFWTLLARLMPLSYLYSFSNLSLHTFGPLLIIGTYIFFTKEFKPKKQMIMITWAFPILYFIFVMGLSLFNVQFSNGSHVPYFFLDYEKYGWFNITNSGIGVFYWLIIIFILVYGIGFGINLLNQFVINNRSRG